MGYTIYHNPRCTKSRQGLAYLTERGIEPKIRDYLKEGLSEEELSKLINELGVKAEDLIRKNEADYKAHFKNKKMSDADWIKAMLKYPKLMQRPIVIHNKKAVIGRPTEKIEEILK